MQGVIHSRMNSYSQMTSIERQRQKDDLLYHMITNSEATTLNDVCMKISASCCL